MAKNTQWKRSTLEAEDRKCGCPSHGRLVSVQPFNFGLVNNVVSRPIDPRTNIWASVCARDTCDKNSRLWQGCLILTLPLPLSPISTNFKLLPCPLFYPLGCDLPLRMSTHTSFQSSLLLPLAPPFSCIFRSPFQLKAAGIHPLFKIRNLITICRPFIELTPGMSALAAAVAGSEPDCRADGEGK